MTCNMAACYRKQPVEDKSYPVDFKAGRIFGEPVCPGKADMFSRR
jgi:hypothetical protein